jgi:ferredoxin
MPPAADHYRYEPSVVLRVDRVACSAHGVCASLLPNNIRLDEWGYPIVVDPRLDPESAGIAVKLCPARALYLDST